MVTRTEEHTDTAHTFLAEARAYLAGDDLLQASEKGWGAAARMVKATAESRGWPHNGHRDLYVTIDRLAEESGDEGLRIGFGLAGALHTNFCEGWLTRETIAAHLSQVGELVGKLDALTGDAPA